MPSYNKVLIIEGFKTHDCCIEKPFELVDSYLSKWCSSGTFVSQQLDPPLVSVSCCSHMYHSSEVSRLERVPRA